MFEPIPDLSSDLEWMLQSGQASPAMLIEALVQDFYGPVMRLARSILQDPAAAGRATRAAFGAALVNLYRYRSQEGVRRWFYTQALAALLDFERRFAKGSLPPEIPRQPFPGVEIEPQPAGLRQAALWQGFDSLPAAQRMMLALHLLENWQVSEIAGVLKRPPGEVQATLDRALAGLDSRYALGAIPSLPVAGELAEALLARWSRPRLSPEESQVFAAAVEQQAGSRGAFQRNAARLKEAVFIGLAILGVIGLVLAANFLIPEPEPPPTPVITVVQTVVIPDTGSRRAEGGGASRGWEGSALQPAPSSDGDFYVVQPGDTLETIAAQVGVSPARLAEANRLGNSSDLQVGESLYVPAVEDMRVMPTVTPVSRAAQPTPLPGDASSADVFLRLWKKNTFWNTVWLDAEFYEYTRPAARTPVGDNERMQLWLSQNQSLMVAGPADGLPEEVMLRLDRRVFQAEPGKGRPWFLEKDWEEYISGSLPEKRRLLFLTTLRQSGSLANRSFEVIGVGFVARRRTLIVNQYGQDGGMEARLWLDSATGFILRNQQLSPDGSTVLREVVVTQITFDQDFPQDLFDTRLPWRGGFARDYTGHPEQVRASRLNAP